MEKTFVSHEQFHELIHDITRMIASDRRFDALHYIYAVPRGGLYPALALAESLGLSIVDDWRSVPLRELLIVDDIVDS